MFTAKIWFYVEQNFNPTIEIIGGVAIIVVIMSFTQTFSV